MSGIGSLLQNAYPPPPFPNQLNDSNFEILAESVPKFTHLERLEILIFRQSNGVSRHVNPTGWYSQGSVSNWAASKDRKKRDFIVTQRCMQVGIYAVSSLVFWAVMCPHVLLSLDF